MDSINNIKCKNERHKGMRVGCFWAVTGSPFSFPDVQEGPHDLKISGSIYLPVEVTVWTVELNSCHIFITKLSSSSKSTWPTFLLGSLLTCLLHSDDSQLQTWKVIQSLYPQDVLYSPDLAHRFILSTLSSTYRFLLSSQLDFVFNLLLILSHKLFLLLFMTLMLPLLDIRVYHILDLGPNSTPFHTLHSLRVLTY